MAAKPYYKVLQPLLIATDHALNRGTEEVEPETRSVSIQNQRFVFGPNPAFLELYPKFWFFIVPGGRLPFLRSSSAWLSCPNHKFSPSDLKLREFFLLDVSINPFITVHLPFGIIISRLTKIIAIIIYRLFLIQTPRAYNAYLLYTICNLLR